MAQSLIGVAEVASLPALVLAGVVSVYVLLWVVGGRRTFARLRTHFLLGVPFGTLIVVGGLLVVYYVLQGVGDLGQPVVIGFRSWSFSYPTGMVLAPFAHSGDGHLIGNLASTVVFAPVAEYFWSHYPTERGSHSFGSWRTNPFIRIALFVLGVFVVGLATSFFVPAPLIGFSGVVFAFAGFALVTRPILAIFALVGERAVRLLYFTLNDPVVVSRGQQQFVTPYWADVAVQGHALGLVIGVVLGLLVVRRRDAWPGAGRVWAAVFAFGVAQSLWTFYWYIGGTEYVLFRGIGLAVVGLLAGLIAVTMARSDPLIVSHIDLSRREAAAGLLIAVILAMALVAVPYNLVSISPGPEAETGVQVRDYTVTYAEDVPNRYISAVQLPLLQDALSINESGVVVTSDRRNAWDVVVSAGRLQVSGRASVAVGGIGWRERVFVNRTAWSVVEGGETYTVFVRGPDGTTERVFAADPVAVPAVVNESHIAIRPVEDGYELAVARNGSLVDTAPVPVEGRNATVADIRFNRTGQTLRAIYEGTRIPIAKYQLRAERGR